MPPNSPEATLAAPDGEQLLVGRRSGSHPGRRRAGRRSTPRQDPRAPRPHPRPSSATRSPESTDGSPGVGSPRGTGPTTSTPRACRSSAAEAARPPTSTTSPHGNRGASRWPPNRTRSETADTITVARSASPRVRLAPRAPTRSTTWPGGVGTPSRWGISPRMMRMVRPSTKPVTIGLERNSATHPIPRRPAASRTRPEPSASAAV